MRTIFLSQISQITQIFFLCKSVASVAHFLCRFADYTDYFLCKSAASVRTIFSQIAQNITDYFFCANQWHQQNHFFTDCTEYHRLLFLCKSASARNHFPHRFHTQIFLSVRISGICEKLFLRSISNSAFKLLPGAKIIANGFVHIHERLQNMHSIRHLTVKTPGNFCVSRIYGSSSHYSICF